MVKRAIKSALAVGLMTVSMASFGQYNYQTLPDKSPLNGSLFDQVGKTKNVDARILYSISLVESNRSAGVAKHVKPDHLVLRAPDRIYRADDKEDACERLNIYAARYKNMVDVGLMQVNLKWNGHRVADRCELIDPANNIRVGAQILREELDKGGLYAIGRYHSRSPGLALAYSKKVSSVFEKLVKNGF